MSNEIGLLKRAIQIPHKACAHMFRHRYITKLFIAIIEQYDCKTKYDVQKAMLEIQSIKIELMENLIIYPENQKQLQILKSLLEEMKIKFAVWDFTISLQGWINVFISITIPF